MLDRVLDAQTMRADAGAPATRREHGVGVVYGLALVLLGLGPCTVPAQILRDGTVGPGASVQPVGPSYVIGEELGATSGSNLFHSFSEFNIAANESATFTGNAAVQNIISRVTGDNGSALYGALNTTIPGANFFLINPNGIVFGPDATFNVDGAFHASTSDSLTFGNGERFGVDTGTPPILSSTDPASFGFIGATAQPIVLNGTSMSGTKGVTLDASSVHFRDGAQVHSLTVDSQAGGDVLISAADEVTFEGVGATGEASAITAFTAGSGAGGSISIRASDISLDDGAFLLSGTFGTGQGSDINLEATGEVRFAGRDGAGGSAIVRATGNPELSVKGGSINIEATTVNATDGAVILGTDGANITIIASDSFSLSAASGVAAQTNSDVDSGDILISAPITSLDEGAWIFNTTESAASGGGIFITAQDSLLLSRNSALASLVLSTGEGGSIDIDAGNLRASDGSSISTVTAQAGDAGDITMRVAGDLTVTSAPEVADLSLISATTLGAGDAGSISVNARTVNISGRGRVSADTDGPGQGGRVDIVASESIIVDGNLPLPGLDVGATISAFATSSGATGSIVLDAPIIELRNGGGLFGGATQTGRSADITLLAHERFTATGQGITGQSSFVFSDAANDANGGFILIDAPVVSLEDGARISTNITEFGRGDAGSIEIRAHEELSMSGVDANGSGSRLLSQSNSADGGDAGSVEVNAARVRLRDGANISSVSYSDQGRGGDVIIAAETVDVSGFSSLSASTEGAGVGGSVVVEAQTALLSEGAQVVTSAGGTGAAGRVEIVASERLSVSGESTQISAVSEDPNNGGAGGAVSVAAGLFAMDDGATIITTSEGPNEAGDVDVFATQAVLTGGASISSENRGSGDAGAIRLDVANALTIEQASALSTEAIAGAGGNIEARAGRVLVLNEASVSTSVSTGDGAGGDVTLDAPLVLAIDGSRVETKAFEGPGGDITIRSADFFSSFNTVLDPDSEFGVSGSINGEITADSEIDPAVQAQYLDASDLIAARCSDRSQDSGFFAVSNAGAPIDADGTLPAFDAVADIAHRGDRLARATTAELAFAEGTAQFRPGDSLGADAHWRAATEHFASVGDHGRLSDALHGLAQAQLARGEYAASVTTLERALRVARESGDVVRSASALGGLGNAQIARGDSQSALTLLRRGLALARGSNANGTHARIANNLGNHFSREGEHEQALAAYTQSAERARLAGETGVLAKALSNAARVSLVVGPSADTTALLTQADEAVTSLPRGLDKAQIMLQLGVSYARFASDQALDDRQRLTLKAASILQHALSLGRGLEDLAVRSRALGELGELYARDPSRTAEALFLTRRALAVALQARRPDLQARWYWQEGKRLWRHGELDSAIASYRRAVDVLERTRQDSLTRYGSSARFFRERVAPVYQDLADALLQVATLADASPREQSLLLEARATAERFKAAELRNYLNDVCVSVAETRVQDLDRVAPDAAIVYPILLRDRTELLVTLPDGLKRFTVPVPADDVERVARSFRLLLEARAPRRELNTAGERLYAWLVAPYAKALARSGIETLVFVPDGVLRTIPMAALHDGSRYLIERYAVAVTPGLTLTDPQPIERGNARMLLAGVSGTAAGGSAEGLPPLEHVTGELESIHSLYGGELLLDEAFTVARFVEELQTREPTIVHIASHGQFTGEPDTSFVLTHDGALSLSDLVDALSTAKYRKDPLELLMLSACATAVGDDRAALGLAGISVRSGARSAVGSLWNVADEAAATVSTSFYGYLRQPGSSRSQALRQAQLDMLRGDLHHPFYWSAFLLINNWL